jgi:hypothetical protein
MALSESAVSRRNVCFRGRPGDYCAGSITVTYYTDCILVVYKIRRVIVSNKTSQKQCNFTTISHYCIIYKHQIHPPLTAWPSS